jgi:uncharacterized membrane protein
MTKATPKQAKTPLTLRQTVAYILLIGSIIGLIASLALTYDKIQVLKNPAYNPSCNINPILSCGSVMKTEQASLLGMPNTIFGIMGYTALLTVAVSLLSGARFKRWFWLCMQGAATIGVGFMHYLFFQGVYRVGAICPYCFVVWMITIPIFWYITQYNLAEGYINLRHSTLNKLALFIKHNHGNILLLWYLAIFAVLLTHFWYYWQTLI